MSDDLNTWQEIAAYLGVSVRTDLNYQAHRVPVGRYAGVAENELD